MSDPIELTPEGLQRTLSIVHRALLLGLLMFSLVVSYMLKDVWHFSYNDFSDVFLLVIPILAVVSTFLGSWLYTKKLNKARNSTVERDALKLYCEGHLMRAALCHGVALFALLAFLLTQNAVHLVIAAIMTLLLLSFRPSREKMERELEL